MEITVKMGRLEEMTAVHVLEERAREHRRLAGVTPSARSAEIAATLSDAYLLETAAKALRAGVARANNRARTYR